MGGLIPAIKLELPAPLTGRSPILDELKGVAIVLVILYHAGGVLLWENRLHGDVGVDMFVVLSGAGLTLGSNFTTARNFLSRRLRRILPAYWIVLTSFLLLNSHFLEKHYTAVDIITHYAGVHAWRGDAGAMSINDSFWFITLILTLYVLYCHVHAYSSEKLLLVGALVSLATALGFFYANQPGTFAHLGMRMPDFFVGLLLGRLLKAGRLEFAAGPALGAALLLLAYIPYTQGFIFAQLPVGLAVMAFYTFAVRPMLPASANTTVLRPLKFLGEHSFEIFLIHQPLMRDYVYYSLGRFFGMPQPSTLAVIFAMAVALAVTLILSVELKQFLQRILPK